MHGRAWSFSLVHGVCALYNRQGKTAETVSFCCACIKSILGYARQRKRKCKRKDKKNPGFIGSMPPRRSEVESEMASSILYEKLAEGVRKYPVLYDKRCADKLKKTLA